MKPLVLTDASFEKEVLGSIVPVMVDFWASWCPPCKMVEPIMQELTYSLKDIVKITKINVDQNPFTASTYKVVGVPTFIVFNQGRELGRCIGAQSKRQLLSMFEKIGIASHSQARSA